MAGKDEGQAAALLARLAEVREIHGTIGERHKALADWSAGAEEYIRASAEAGQARAARPGPAAGRGAR